MNTIFETKDFQVNFDLRMNLFFVDRIIHGYNLPTIKNVTSSKSKSMAVNNAKLMQINLDKQP